MSFEAMPFDTQHCEFQSLASRRRRPKSACLSRTARLGFSGSTFIQAGVRLRGRHRYYLTDLRATLQSREIGQSLDSELVSLVYRIAITRDPSFYGRYFILPVLLVILRISPSGSVVLQRRRAGW